MASPKRAASGILAGCTGSIAVAQHAVADQVSMLRLFLGDPRLRAPALAIWVASFGGALHEPVTAFFMVELGASTAQMGNFGAIRTVGALTLGPAYGWLIDRYTAFLPTILSAFICATGCCLRGFTPAGRTDLLYASAVVLGLGAANFWNVVGTHLACATDRDLRPLVVSAYFVQVNTLELLGKLVYPLWDAGLHLSPLLAADRLLRFRVTMSVCSFFCVFGVGNLLFNGQSMRQVNCHDEVAEEEETAGADQADDVVPSSSASSIGSATSSDASTISKTAAAKKKQKKSSAVGDPVAFLAVSTVLICLAAGLTAVKTLWPLYVRFQFEWEDHAYARMSLAGSLASILGACLMPAAAKRVGAPVVAIVLCAAACIGVISGFPAEAVAVAHVGGALLFMSCASALRPCLEALASLAVAPRLQGRVFAFLKLADAFGQMLGSYAGTRLYELSTSRGRPLAEAALLPMHGGAMPFVLVGAALLVSTTALAVALLPAGGGKHPASASCSASSSEPPCAAVGMDAFVNSGNTVSIEAEHELANLLHRSARVAKCSVAE